MVDLVFRRGSTTVFSDPTPPAEQPALEMGVRSVLSSPSAYIPAEASIRMGSGRFVWRVTTDAYQIYPSGDQWGIPAQGQLFPRQFITSRFV